MMSIEEYSLKSFIDTDLKVFSNLDNTRSIPSVIDGLKNSQRKAVYSMLKHGNNEIKVAQLGSYAAQITHYAHGEVSMCDTIVGLAQNFPGSNNLNLFEPIGQFGSILSSEASEHRYIFTKPSAYLHKVISKDDESILEYQYVDGDRVEPVNYFPVIPLWLVNGVVGIGTGHSTRILPRNVSEVASLMTKMLKGVNVQDRTLERALTPYFNGWKGDVVKGKEENQWEFHGVIEKVNSTTLKVKELPPTYSIDKFKEILIKLIDEGKVRDYDNNSDDVGFDITITVPREVARNSLDELKSIFKLVTTVTENVTMWNSEGKIVRYDSVKSALDEFVRVRTEKFEMRRLSQMQLISLDIAEFENRIIFINAWNDMIKEPHKLDNEALGKELQKCGFDLQYFSLMLSMRISSLSKESVDLYKKKLVELTSTFAMLNDSKAEDMFSSEIAGF